MDRQSIIYVWIGGAALAVLVYLIGPDYFMSGVWRALDGVEAMFHAMLSFLGNQAFNVVRAAAIAIYAVFLVLGLLAMQRGIRAVGALIFVTLGFIILVWRSDPTAYVSTSRWFTALLIAIIGAVIMTQRLIDPPRRPPPRDGGPGGGGLGGGGPVANGPGGRGSWPPYPGRP